MKLIVWQSCKNVPESTLLCWAAETPEPSRAPSCALVPYLQKRNKGQQGFVVRVTSCEILLLCWVSPSSM